MGNNNTKKIQPEEESIDYSTGRPQACFNINILLKGRYTRGGLWPNGEVYYRFNESVSEDLKTFFNSAIGEFKKHNIPIIWIHDHSKEKTSYVMILSDNTSNPWSYVGHIGAEQELNLPYPNYPSGSPLRLTCILHEMCHTVGLEHEHNRPDSDSHITLTCDTTDINYSKEMKFAFGHYDYYSIMHYGHGTGFTTMIEELKNVADKGETFSAGDISVLRHLYGKGKLLPHRADWHMQCGPNCTTETCSCGACKRVGRLNCGYSGSEAHWSCCMNEEYDSQCSTHSGFWHRSCSDERCNDVICYCKSCGGGCTYIGTSSHWSCCGNEEINSICVKLIPYNKI